MSKNPKYPGVYCIRNKMNGKVYIGEAINIYLRWIEHRCRLRNNYCENSYLQRAWSKYGEDSFLFEVLERCEIEDLIKRESHWCTVFNSYNRSKGYNLRVSTSDGKYLALQESKDKMSVFWQANPQIYTKERNNKIRLAKLGVPRSEETKLKLSIIWKERYEKGTAINPMSGKSHTKETKAKIGAKAKNRENKPYKNLEVYNQEDVLIETLSRREGISKYGRIVYPSINMGKPKNRLRFKIVDKTQ